MRYDSYQVLTSSDTGPLASSTQIPAGRQRAPSVFVDFHHRGEGVLHVNQALRDGVALGYQLGEQRGGNGVTAFGLRLQEQWYPCYHRHLSVPGFTGPGV